MFFCVSTLTASMFLQTSESIVAGSRVRELSVVAWPTRASARSLPRTLECPGQKIHRTLFKLLWLIAIVQSAWSMPVDISTRVLIESVRQTSRVTASCLTHSRISVIAFISSHIEDVVRETYPESSLITSPCKLAVQFQPE